MHVPIPLKDFMRLQTLLSESAAIIQRITSADDLEIPSTVPVPQNTDSSPRSPDRQPGRQIPVSDDSDEEIEYTEYGIDALDS